jgi:hypothetical protein
MRRTSIVALVVAVALVATASRVRGNQSVFNPVVPRPPDLALAVKQKQNFVNGAKAKVTGDTVVFAGSKPGAPGSYALQMPLNAMDPYEVSAWVDVEGGPNARCVVQHIADATSANSGSAEVDAIVKRGGGDLVVTLLGADGSTHGAVFANSHSILMKFSCSEGVVHLAVSDNGLDFTDIGSVPAPQPLGTPGTVGAVCSLAGHQLTANDTAVCEDCTISGDVAACVQPAIDDICNAFVMERVNYGSDSPDAPALVESQLDDIIGKLNGVAGKLIDCPPAVVKQALGHLKKAIVEDRAATKIARSRRSKGFDAGSRKAMMDVLLKAAAEKRSAMKVLEAAVNPFRL